jgi:plastocyanin
MHSFLRVAACAAFAAACGDDSSPTNSGGSQPVATTQVTIADNRFTPSANSVNAGQTVQWTWTGSNPHNVTFDNASVGNSPTQTTGTHSRTFASTGEFSYYCSVHGRSVMSGRVVVGAGSP